ncbi:kynurenine 3-monooxygenase, mitochondrial precursor [Tilletia horrida]|nr:kynurenine 3-monooxygenase, mitochondrial precursor [Tilletia horrida]
MKHVAVVGAGPVGSLAALALAERGCSVDLYERQPAPSSSTSVTSTASAGNTRSINLAISTRALTALEALTPRRHGGSGGDEEPTLADVVLASGIPMRARMIHHMPTTPAPSTSPRARPTQDKPAPIQVVLPAAVKIQQAAAPAQVPAATTEPPTTPAVEHSGSTAPPLFDSVGPAHEDEAQDSIPTPAHRRPSLSLQAAPPEAEEHLEVALDSQDYGIDPSSHCIHSVDRSRLSALLLSRAAAHPHINVIWGHALQDVRFLPAPGNGVELDFEHSHYVTSATAEQEGAQELVKEPTTARADLVLGCDGMHSVVRRALDAHQPLGVQQSYIDSAYLELHIPSPRRSEAEWPLSPHHLHIWPRHSFMLIALPNADRSFTCTLFAPYALFGASPPPSASDAKAKEHPLAGALSTPERALGFFRTYFPDALQLMGAQHVMHAISARATRPGRLGSVRLEGGMYHERGAGRAVLLGDAAHAMVPFYGQGLNCGLEDVRVLIETLETHGVLPFSSTTSDESRAQALEAYSRTRHPALCAILQLAQQNYEEMSHRVVSRTYLARKWLDGVLMRLLAPSSSSSSSSAAAAAARRLEEKVEVVLAADEEDGSSSSGSGTEDSHDSILLQKTMLKEARGSGGEKKPKSNSHDASSSSSSSVLDFSLAVLRSCFAPHVPSRLRLRRRSRHLTTSTPGAPKHHQVLFSPARSNTKAPTTATARSERALGRWKSLYTMVTFTNMPYDAVLRQAGVQDRIVSYVGVGLGVGLGLGLAGGIWGVMTR